MNAKSAILRAIKKKKETTFNNSTSFSKNENSTSIPNSKNEITFIIPDDLASFGCTCDNIKDFLFNDLYLGEGDNTRINLVFSEGVTYIPDHFCENVQSIQTVYIPNSVSSIGEYAFAYSYNINNIYIGDNINEIKAGAFMSCKIKEFSIPKNVTVIEDSVFRGCADLEHLYLHPNINAIKANAFEYCDSLIQFNLDDWKNIEYIGKQAFKGIQWEKIIIPNNVSVIDEAAFQNCIVTDISWPDNCFEIPKKCFCDCHNLVNISNISHVKKIGDAAFLRCKSLNNFEWPIGCVEIPKECFNDSGLEEINGIKNITKIGRRAFYKSSIKDFIWPEKCTTIPEGCFECSCLENIHNLKISVIEELAFSNTEIKELDLTSSVLVELATSVVDGCEGFESIKWPYYFTCDIPSKLQHLIT